MEEIDVPAYVAQVGTKVQGYWREAAEKYGLTFMIVGDGYPCVATFSFEHELEAELSTLYTQKMLERGFLATNAIYSTIANTEEIIDLYGEAIDEVIGEIAEAVESETVQEQLKGPVRERGFARLIR